MRLNTFYFPTGITRHAWAIVIILGMLGPVRNAVAAEPVSTLTNSVVLQPMSLPEAINIGLRQSPSIEKARKRLEESEGVVIETRAIAIPKAGISGDYSAVESSAVDSPPAIAGFPFTFGTEQNWTTQLRVVQSIYEGGRILSSLRTAKLITQQSLLEYQVAVADTILQIQVAYYAVLLAEQQIAVQEASIQLLTRELTDTTRRFEAGTVPRFNVLRAEVELASATPRLSRARNNLRITRNHLSNVLGFNLAVENTLEIPMVLTTKLEAESLSIGIADALNQALARRNELEVLRKSRAIRKEEVISAKGGYRPSLQAFAGYDARSSMFTEDLSDPVHGWITGVQLNWNIFDGRRTEGRVRSAQARYDLAGIELDDTARRIELEVRVAYSTFTEAGEVLKSQAKVVEQAEEALRLASARSDAGTGTQLDVLAAQTSLTDARNTHAQALYEFAVARVRLEHAIGTNVPGPGHAPP